MLKDYKTRVTGNYELLRALLNVVNRDADKLIALNAAADREAEGLGAHPLGNVGYPLALDVVRRDYAISLSRLQIHARAERRLRRRVGCILARAVERHAAPCTPARRSASPPCRRPRTSFRRNGLTSSTCSRRTKLSFAALQRTGPRRSKPIAAMTATGSSHRLRATTRCSPARAAKAIRASHHMHTRH